MNKLLSVGLLLAIVPAYAGPGHFYVGANLGMDFTKMKINYNKYTRTLTGTATAGVVNMTEDKSERLSVKKNKTKFRAELDLGYMRAYECVTLGLDLTFGTAFGKNKKMYPGWQELNPTSGEALANGTTHQLIKAHDVDADKDYVSVKEKWHVGIMPRVGRYVTQKVELYATAGLKAAEYKVTYLDEEGETGDNTVTHSSKTKLIPVCGAGVNWHFNDKLFAKLEYNYELNKSLRMPSDLADTPTITKGDDAQGGGNAHNLKHHAHVVKLGLGYKF